MKGLYSVVLAGCLLGLVGCKAAQPMDYQSPSDIPDRPGLLSGNNSKVTLVMSSPSEEPEAPNAVTQTSAAGPSAPKCECVCNCCQKAGSGS